MKSQLLIRVSSVGLVGDRMGKCTHPPTLHASTPIQPIMMLMNSMQSTAPRVEDRVMHSGKCVLVCCGGYLMKHADELKHLKSRDDAQKSTMRSII